MFAAIRLLPVQEVARAVYVPPHLVLYVEQTVKHTATNVKQSARKYKMVTKTSTRLEFKEGTRFSYKVNEAR